MQHMQNIQIYGKNNYNKDYYFLSPTSEILSCILLNSYSIEINPCEDYSSNGEIKLSHYSPNRPQYEGKDCDKLYYNQKSDSIANK